MADVERLAGILPAEQLPDLVGDLERLKAVAMTRLLEDAAPNASSNEPDQLLTVEEAAGRLAVSKDHLYRHADEFPFSVRVSPQVLRFSELGIAEFIRQRQGIS